jgi:glycosyltransferase involved in cell wall biosynthesis
LNNVGNQASKLQARERLTLIVCTRNRLPKLRAAIGCILSLRCRLPCQLVVVDNGSTDGTWQWLQSLESTPNFRINLVSEPTAGLSRARNTGVRHALGDIIAFTDDDCYPTESFLDDVLDAFSAGGIDYCGGRVLLHDPADLPVSINTSTTPRVFSPNSFIPAGVISGANMAFSRTLLDVVGAFDVGLGAGSVTRSAEDTDFLFRSSWCGFKGMYTPVLTVRHHHERRSSADRFSIAAAYDVGRGAYYAKHLLKRQTRLVMLKNWYWATDLRSKSGRGILLHELCGAALYLWNLLGSRSRAAQR